MGPLKEMREKEGLAQRAVFAERFAVSVKEPMPY